MKRKIYVASSWRNEHQEAIVKELRILGYEVYDFKHPGKGQGFQWSKIDPNWENWSMEDYREKLSHKRAQFGFNRDFDAMKAADICVLVLPCGRSAHLEAGWMKGAGKKVIAFIPPGERIEPELMYGLLDGIALCIQDLGDMILGENNWDSFSSIEFAARSIRNILIERYDPHCEAIVSVDGVTIVREQLFTPFREEIEERDYNEH